ncbi:GNAT family N-acetyltransferase [Salinisphaera sp.]|uniref:GNAT family N-acetyltransferase n=1 Tax=Salinisphaera sp. TaxID=1914330 RepID=UPI002D781B40|nr:GNAT family N-acetyltransferase [Salinisphaera sp.]HET7313870.1 GNAT family N-acetyltransferase [Salinisphaera sp.]
MSDSRIDVFWLDEMPASLFHEIVMLRESVFVVEQTCAYQETDMHDLGARHLTLRIDEALAGYLRIVVGREPAIGRVLIATAFRGHGLAYALMRAGIEEADRLYGETVIHVSAQAHLRGFYERLGFVVTSDVYLEDGIPHCAMQRAPR